MAKKKTDEKLKYQIVLDEFLERREWTDEYEVNNDEKWVSLDTGINISEGSQGRLIIEAHDDIDVVDVFIYYSQSCKEAKRAEMAILLNGIHQRWKMGRFMFLEDGRIRWHHRVDFEGSQPTGLSLDRMVSDGWAATGRFADTIAAVSLTKQSAADALEEYDRDQEANQNTQSASGGEGPTEL